MTTFDINWVRGQFPNFDAPDFADGAFFENAGGSFACRQVIDRLTRFYNQRKVQPYAGYAASWRGGAEMDEARGALAQLLGVDVAEVSFGPSTTQNTYVLAQAFRQAMQPGDVIIVTNQDHEANSGPWRRLADDGIEIREWQIDAETGHLDPARLADLLDDKVRLVCFPHCSNVVGEINDVQAVSNLVHEAGAVVCVDGVSYAPHGFPDVGALGADIYLFSAYKTYGPHQGIMVIRRDLGERLPNQGHHFNGGTLFYRFTPAGPDHAQVAASAGMVEYMAALADRHGLSGATSSHDLMRAQETRLLQPLLDHIGSKNSVRLLGPSSARERAPTVAFVTERPPAEVAADLQARGIYCDAGDFYAHRALDAQGIDPDRGVVRASFVHYTSADEVDRLMTALDEVL